MSIPFSEAAEIQSTSAAILEHLSLETRYYKITNETNTKSEVVRDFTFKSIHSRILELIEHTEPEIIENNYAFANSFEIKLKVKSNIVVIDIFTSFKHNDVKELESNDINRVVFNVRSNQDDSEYSVTVNSQNIDQPLTEFESELEDLLFS